VNATNIKCNACGASASPLEIEVVGTADLPSEIVDVISWIRCPKCGPRKQTASSKLAQKDTVDYIGRLPAAHF
jgi:transcription elongation factor Elf1